MRKRFCLLFFIFTSLVLLSYAEDIEWIWPFGTQPQFSKEKVVRRPGSDWFKEGWAIPQDGAFLAYRKKHPHKGLDILSNEGTDLLSISSGQVVHAGEYVDKNGKPDGAGIKIIAHCPNYDNYEYIAKYCHLQNYHEDLAGASYKNPKKDTMQ